MKVTEEILAKRINRKLSRIDERLCKARGANAIRNLGDYYVSNLNNNVLDSFVNIEVLGRELGVLTEREEVAWTGAEAA